MKIQNNVVRDMSTFEKNVCLNLKVSDVNGVRNFEECDTHIIYKERWNRCKIEASVMKLTMET